LDRRDGCGDKENESLPAISHCSALNAMVLQCLLHESSLFFPQ
jgi:hypothetical protein